MQRQVLKIAGMVVLALLPVLATAQSMTLQEVTQRAIETSPEVQTRWHNFLAAQHEKDAARGAYLPRVDLSANAARRHRDEPGISNVNFSQRGVTLTLTQMLFDGFATRNDVERLNYAALVRYFEVLDSAENTALEATRAYIDVLRYRDLVKLAEDNYVRHRQFFDQIQERTKAGVGRRVDLEQASGRLALAESNLLTEISNLHDVSARFQRIVGITPVDTLSESGLLKDNIPVQLNGALQRAFDANPALLAAIENIGSAKSEIDVRRARFAPRVELRANTDQRNKNDVGVGPHANSRTVEVVLNWNLYKGGSDNAALKQAAEQLNTSKDLRDKACVDLRQTLTIAYNDIQRLAEQLKYLDQHQLSIEKAREAYQRQFEIGQRTLLDLLDTENEYFQARRAYVNGTRDHELAHARTQAGMGALLSSLNIARNGMPTLADLSAKRPEGNDVPGCALESVSALRIDKEALMAKAPPLFKPAPPPAAPEAAPAPASPTPTTEAGKPASSNLQLEPEKIVDSWLASWMARDLPKYFSFYADDFKPARDKGRDHADWEKNRTRIIGSSSNIRIKAEDVKVKRGASDSKNGKEKAEIEFRQTYRSDSFGDSVTKTLKLKETQGQWKIQREETRDQILEKSGTPAAPTTSAAPAVDESISRFVDDWAAAWATQNLDAYFAAYADQFEPAKSLSKTDWQAQRSKKIGAQKEIRIDIADLKLINLNGDNAQIQFRQTYRSASHRDTTIKSLDLVKVNGKWRIARESSK